MILGASLILAGFHGKAATEEGPLALVRLGVGGYIVFGRNVESPGQVHGLLGELDRMSGGRAIFAVDQEGGRVARLRAPTSVWPPMRTLGDRLDSGLARRVGHALGTELRAVGFTMDFAPVLDVNDNPKNPVIGDRAFGTQPEQVIATAVPFAAGLADAGVLACGKHFPGHGDVDVDSHLDLPVCALSEEALRGVHLRPFAAAISAGIPALMTAHVLYPAIDPEQPATMSSPWIQGVLRRELGWDGAVLTDDMEMGAVGARMPLEDACVAAIRAGCDGLLICKTLELIEGAARRLDAEIERDPAFRARCLEARRRLDRLAATRPRPAPAAELLAHLGVPEHQLLAQGGASAFDPTERQG